MELRGASRCEDEDAGVDDNKEYESGFYQARALFLIGDGRACSVDAADDTENERNCGWDGEELEELAAAG